MVDISEATNDELRQEIERRKIADTKPKSCEIEYIPRISMVKLKTVCEDYIDSVADGDNRDFDSHISETAVELFYGKDVWKWINKTQRG